MSIILSELTKRYGANAVVSRVSLQIEEGELFVLLGGSGSGKSTILRIIAGLVQPDRGRIELNGRDVTDLPAQSRGVGFVFQNYSIFRHMTVDENVRFGLRIRKVPAAAQRQRSEELLDLVGLGGLGNRYADQLSGGQQQRVALARALAYRPDVLLLDEPFGALDVKIRAQLRQSLREIQRRLRVTTILVTHDQEEAFELADRIGVIDRGHLVEVGTPESLYHQPRTELTATFIGGGNVLVGREENGHARLGKVLLPLPEGAPAHEAGAPVRLLFRPETVLLSRSSFSPDRQIMTLGQGAILERVFAGSLERVIIGVEGLRGVRPLAPPPGYGESLTRIEAVQPSESADAGSFAPGEQVWIGLRRFHVLQPSGLKILIRADETAAGRDALSFGCLLAEAAAGPVTLLGLAAPAEDAASGRGRDASLRAWLEALRESLHGRLPHVETRLRRATPDEIVLEAQEGSYELVVMAAAAADSGPPVQGESLRRQLLVAGIPTLLVSASRPSIERILICTAVGEPGKSDVRFGGRIARRTGARATVLHVRSAQSGAAERERVERHLEQARASLRILGVDVETQIAEGAPLEQIGTIAGQGDYDMVVIGASYPRAPDSHAPQDFAREILARADRPVLIVPMLE